jgi:hypothetical protein
LIIIKRKHFKHLITKSTNFNFKFRKDKKNKIKQKLPTLSYLSGLSPIFLYKSTNFKNLVFFKEFTKINNFLVIISNPFIFKIFFLYLQRSISTYQNITIFNRVLSQISNFLFLKKKKTINNVFYDKHFIFFIKKAAIKVFSFSKLASFLFL